ncbi:MAG: hypothetical protein ACI9HU_001618, partial [Colwellia sp.]
MKSSKLINIIIFYNEFLEVNVSMGNRNKKDK